MTKVLSFTTEYFPSITSFSKVAEHASIAIQASENYQKNSLRNRCYLTGSQGRFLLSVPLASGKNQQQNIKDVRIAYDFDWISQHLKTISNNYVKSPFFHHYFPNVSQILQKKEKFLLDLNWEILCFLLQAYTYEKTISYDLVFEISKCNPIPRNLPPPYPQLFEAKTGFVAGLSVLDLLFCMGPTRKYFI
ncbi:MAG: WbqC family protein [Saprospiraceae bacterium]|nr:WbqC family protein [Saprospiraceae bacterium]